jgi:predicted RND superfamily exporter protein
MSRLASLPLHAPRLTLLLLLAVTLALGSFAAFIRVDSAIENLLPANDPDRLYYNEIKKVFGSEEATVIAVFAEDVFASSVLAKVDRLSQRLSAIRGVRDVISLTTVKGVATDELGLTVGRLMEKLPASDEERKAFEDRVLQNPLAIGNIVSEDRRTCGVIVLFDDLTDQQFLDLGIERAIEAAVAAEVTPPERFAITGLQTLKVNGARLMEQDLARFVPLSIAIVVLVLAAAFRTKRGVMLPLGAVLLSVVWTLGVMVLAGAAINMGTLVLPPLLMAIGIAYAIHVVSSYYHEVRPGRPRAEAVAATLDHVRVPVAVASLTTILGFASLALSPIRAIAELGLYSMFGVFSIFLISLTFVPAMLMLMPDPPPHYEGPQDDWFAGLLTWTAHLAMRRRRAVLVLSAIVCLLSLWGATRIRVETDYLGFFSPMSRFRIDNARIARELGGTQPIYVVIDGDAPGSVLQIETLWAIRDLQQFIAEQPGSDRSVSIADFISVVWKGLNPDAKTPLPERQADVEQILQFVSSADVKPVVTPDHARANIIVGTHLSGSAAVSDLVRRIEEYAKTRFRRGLQVRVTGTIVLLNRSADALARGQVAGLGQVLFVLLVLMSFLFLSLRAGLLSLVPNVTPIIILFGVMGWLRIDLNISTAMIAVIAVGIAIDDTIHYLSAFNKEIRATADTETAILRVGRSVGRPIVFTSIGLAAGFLIVYLSNFQPIQHFGLLASITMVVALFADLLMVPALVMTTTIVTLWDLLYLKLGPEPHRQISLFAGLRPFQAKIVVLMARLASAAPGDFITRRGEMKAEMYVLLNGRVEVRRADGELLRTLGRGDVLGEMGLVRARPRSADVTAAAPSEYLVLDGGFLDRLQRRHPRIAAKVFLNLTRILSDRLENTTDQLVAVESEHARGEA